jgi:small subunit ribosomal protein S6
MTEHVREYETIYVLNPELSDSAAKDFMLKMKDLIQREGGKNIKVQCWGRRKLAFERENQQRGIYVHHMYLGLPGLVKEFERNLGNEESVMLRQSVLVNPSVDPATRPEEADQFDAPVIREQRREYGRRDDMDFDRFDDMMGGDRDYPGAQMDDME